MTTAINWDQLVDQVQLPDGDVIGVRETQNAVPPGEIEIALELGGNLTWWKGLQASEIVLCQCQDNQRYSAARVSYADFKTRVFTFWKAKVFGVHTPMYHLNNQDQHLKGGNSYLFEWLRD